MPLLTKIVRCLTFFVKLVQELILKFWISPPYLYFILIIIISLNDIGAFIFGKLIGKIPFFPNISPNKTFEGSLSGIFLGTLGGLTYKFLTGGPEISMPTIFMLSIALTIFGQMGDLFESGMKRLSGIKDSGNIIPGHGGVMDRQDSFVFVIPVLYYFIQWKAI